MTALRVAMLSVHTCPLAALGAKETGGMNVYVREVARELGRMGARVDVFTRSQNPAVPRVVALGPGARVVHLPAGPEAPLEREAVAEHLDAFADGVDGWRAAARTRYDVIHAHYWLSGVVGERLVSRWGAPRVQMFHTLARLKDRVARRAADREPGRRLEAEARLAPGADLVVAASPAEQAALVGEYGVAPERVAVIPCGVDTDLFAPGDQAGARRRLSLDAGALVLYVGRIAPIKGLETLLEAFARLRASGTAVRLVVVGGEVDEPREGHEARVRRRAHTLRLGDAVRFVGAQPQTALPDWYRAADVLVLPSYYESFGLVALEAMASGLPVAASSVGGLAATVRDGETGVLVPEGDAAALAGALAALLADAARRRCLGAAGVAWAATHRWACVATALCREYLRYAPREAAAALERSRCAA